MRRARISIAARRVASSICSHASGALGGTLGWSKKSRFNCIAALLARRRLSASDAKSVDEITQPEQIAEPAEIADGSIGIDRRRSSYRLRVPIGPACRDQRPAAVGQNRKKIVDAALPDGANHGQRATLESMTPARDRYGSQNILAMGSLWPLRSTPSIITC